MKSYHFSSNDANNTTTTEYCTLENGGTKTWDSTENNVKQLCSPPGTFSNARVTLNGSPGTGKSYTYTLMVNNTATSIVITISDLETSGEDTTHTATVSAGQTVYWRCVPSGTPNARIPNLTVEFEGDNANESNIPFGPNGSTADGYVSFKGGSIPNATYLISKQVISTPGTISDLYIVCSGAWADGGSATLYVNGSATSLVATVASSGSSGSDTSNSVAVSAGDTVAWFVTAIGTQPTWAGGATFTATTDGEFPICGGTSNDPGDTGDDFAYINIANGVTPNGTEANFRQLTGGLQVSDLYAVVTTAPGTGKDWTLTLRDDGSDTALAASISGTGTTGNDTSNTASIDPGSLLTLKITPSAPPNEPTLPGEISWGMTGVVVEAADAFIPQVIMF